MPPKDTNTHKNGGNKKLICLAYNFKVYKTFSYALLFFSVTRGTVRRYDILLTFIMKKFELS